MPRVEMTMSAGFQFTAPSALRKRLSLRPGDKVVIDTDREVVTIEKAETHEEKVKRAFADLDEWRENLPDDVKARIKKHAGWTVNQFHEYYDNLPETRAYLKEKYGIESA